MFEVLADERCPGCPSSCILRRVVPTIRFLSLVSVIAVALASAAHAQTRSVPRPPAQKPGAPPDGSAAPDGYSPIPAWAGQTHAPRVAVSVPYAVETVATGIANGYSIEFMPDGRMLLVERPGRYPDLDCRPPMGPGLHFRTVADPAPDVAAGLVVDEVRVGSVVVLVATGDEELTDRVLSTVRLVERLDASGCEVQR